VQAATPNTKTTAGTINAFFIRNPSYRFATLSGWIKTLNIADVTLLRVLPDRARALELGTHFVSSPSDTD
jgi:hypothetical protein